MTAYSDIPQLYDIDSIHLLVMFILNIVFSLNSIDIKGNHSQTIRLGKISRKYLSDLDLKPNRKIISCNEYGSSCHDKLTQAYIANNFTLKTTKLIFSSNGIIWSTPVYTEEELANNTHIESAILMNGKCYYNNRYITINIFCSVHSIVQSFVVSFVKTFI